jgi:hypothetical protein
MNPTTPASRTEAHTPPARPVEAGGGTILPLGQDQEAAAGRCEDAVMTA